MLKASKVIGSVEQGDGDAQPTIVPKRDHGGQARQHRSESEGFSLTMTQVSIVQGSRPLLRSTAPGTFAIITLVWYLSMGLYKGNPSWFPAEFEPPKYTAPEVSPSWLPAMVACYGKSFRIR